MERDENDPLFNQCIDPTFGLDSPFADLLPDYIFETPWQGSYNLPSLDDNFSLGVTPPPPPSPDPAYSPTPAYSPAPSYSPAPDCGARMSVKIVPKGQVAGGQFEETMRQMEANREQIRVECPGPKMPKSKPQFSTRTEAFTMASKRYSEPIPTSPTVSAYQINALRAMMSEKDRIVKISDQCKEMRKRLMASGGLMNRKWRVDFDFVKNRFIYKHPFCFIPHVPKQLRLAAKAPMSGECYEIGKATALARSLAETEASSETFA